MTTTKKTAQKDSSLSSDTVREQRCPKCRRIDTVVYNGNYWCTRCPWIMGERSRPKRIIVAYLRQCHQECTQRGDAAGAKRMEFYLDNHGAPVSTSEDDGTDSKPVDQEG